MRPSSTSTVAARSTLLGRRAAAWLAAVALGWLLAQTLGGWHRVAHGAPVAQAAASGAAPGSAWFGDHEPGSAECRLVDQLSHADALPSLAVAVLPILALPVACAWVPVALARRHVAAFRARGPPRA